MDNKESIIVSWKELDEIIYAYEGFPQSLRALMPMVFEDVCFRIYENGTVYANNEYMLTFQMTDIFKKWYNKQTKKQKKEQKND